MQKINAQVNTTCNPIYYLRQAKSRLASFNKSGDPSGIAGHLGLEESSTASAHLNQFYKKTISRRPFTWTQPFLEKHQWKPEMKAPLERSTALEWACHYKSLGWEPIPVPLREKNPGFRDWQDLRIPKDDLPNRFGTPVNIGILLGEASKNLNDVDLDSPEAIALAPIYLPTTGCIFGRASKPRSHWFYKTNAETVYKKYLDPDPLPGQEATLVELRTGPGHQTIVPPSIYASGEEIQWHIHNTPASLNGAELQRSVAQLAACALVARHWPKTGSRQDTAMALSGFLLRGGMSVDEALRFVESAARISRDDEVSKRVETVNSTAQKLLQGENVTGGPRLAELLVGNGKKIVLEIKKWLGLANSSEILLYDATEVGDAEFFVARHGHELRYCYSYQNWLIWDGTRWVEDTSGQIMRTAKETVKELKRQASSIPDPETKKLYTKHAVTSQTENHIKAMINLAKSEVAVESSQLDVEPFVLNVLNGTIDLRTGTLRPHDPADLITKMAPVEYDSTAECPNWQAFLNRIMDSNLGLIEYLQRVIGYALTGDTSEQVIFYFYGQVRMGRVPFSTLLPRCWAIMRSKLRPIYLRKDIMNHIRLKSPTWTELALWCVVRLRKERALMRHV